MFAFGFVQYLVLYCKFNPIQIQLVAAKTEIGDDGLFLLFQSPLVKAENHAAFKLYKEQNNANVAQM